ncbi:AAA family ATPase [Actinoplanes sp. NPDC048791]|uniref:ATP-binding protein n=1 Tax=Actinoplanes sp. NPDC048791 TaxID=3154623 RepID=UPI0033CFA62E
MTHAAARPRAAADIGLVGRGPEWAVLARALARIGFEGSSTVVHGEAGVGKSSLLRMASTTAGADGALVLSASGIESESMMPFAGLHQLLRPLIADVGSLPSVQQRALLTALGLREGPTPQLFLIALAALTLVVDAAVRRPVVLIVDDAQWLDAPSNDVLAFLSRRIRHDRVVMITGLRAGHDVPVVVAGADEIALTGLDEQSSQEIIDQVAADLTVVERRVILGQACGNPLALVELPAAWRSTRTDVRDMTSASVSLTSRLERAFAARIEELPGDVRDVLLVAAVATGEDLNEVLAGTTVLAGVPVTTDAVETAEQAGLVSLDAVSVRFRHPLVRSGVLYRESRRRRRAAHAAMSVALSGQPHRSVWHQAQSVQGPDDDVADRLDASHVESLRRGSVMTAVIVLERAAQLTTRSRRRGLRLLLAARHAYGLGRADLVNRLLDGAEHDDLSALDLARAEWLREMFVEADLGNAARVRQLCRYAARSAGSGERDLALDLLFTAGLRCWWADTEPAARNKLVAVARSLSSAREDPRSIAAIAMTEPLAEGAQTMRRLAAAAPGSVSDPDQLRQLGMAARAVGAEVLAADYFDAAESRLREQGQLGLLPHVLAVQAAVRCDLGDWRRAAQSLQEGRRLAAETGQPTWSAGIAAVEAVFAALTGSCDAALRHAADIEAACPERVQRDFLSLAQIARGVAHLSDGQHASAYVELAPIFDSRDPRHHARQQLSGLMFLAEAAARCGRLADARAVLHRMEILAETIPSPVLLVHLLYARAVLADHAEAEDLYQAALRADLTRWPWPRARIQLAYGNWLRLRRRPAEAREPLRSALGTFELIGAAGWARQTRTGLRAAGESDATPAPAGADSLMTADERQIAHLAAQGLSNREIGQQLYLSPRTVGSRLYRIFPKLGIKSRAQLATRLKES